MAFRQKLTAAWEAFQSGSASLPRPANEVPSPHAAMMFRPISRCLIPAATRTKGIVRDDASLITRIVRAYQKAQDLSGDHGSFWSNHYGGIKAPIHTALVEGDIASLTQLLRNPASNNLFYGFDGPYLLGAVNGEIDDDTKALYYDLLLRLGEALGAMRLEYSETPVENRPTLLPVDAILERIGEKIGFVPTFPNIYPDDQGLTSSGGAITWRPLQAIYQAFLVASHLKKITEQRVVEIGAGLGRNAYYAAAFGIYDYTIVDLPLTNVAQAYFLGMTLGETKVSLYGEPQAPGSVKILPPENFHASAVQYDLALNADSFTEMSIDTAQAYLSALSKRSPRLISINHEFNAFAVSDLCRGSVTARTPYWLRHGYVMELISFSD